MENLNASADFDLKDKTKRLPHVGQRMVRSAVGVLCCVLVYYLRGCEGTPFYSALAVLWCIQPYSGSTKEMAIQRLVGTLIGAVFGFVTLLLQVNIFGTEDEYLRYILTPVMIIPIIYVTLLIKKRNASYFSCVVFLSVCMVHITDSNPYTFVLSRMTDTFIGIVLGILINSCHLPRNKRRDVLLVARLDDAITQHKESLTPYSKVELNRIIDDGAKLTLATMRTPASLIKPLADIHLKLPIIVMDGAALYDFSTNTFLHAYILSHETAEALCAKANALDMQCFVNTLADNSLIIYHGELYNDAEISIRDELSRSPYRNYIKRPFTRQDKVIYVMCIDKTEKIEGFNNQLISEGLDKKLKILCYASKDYPGYSYIKIYNKNASCENMVQYLLEDEKLEKVCMIGSGSDCDVLTSATDLDSITKALKNTYEPVKLLGKKSNNP